MSQNINMCEIPEPVKKCLKNFRLKKVKQSSAIILKIDADKRCVELEQELELEDLVAELPERSPRYIGLIVRHEREHDRITFPLMCVFFSPDGAKTEHQMMYANTLNQLTEAGGFTKVFKVRELEEITDEWLKENLSFFK